jgi:hypothetical protein
MPTDYLVAPEPALPLPVAVPFAIPFILPPLVVPPALPEVPVEGAGVVGAPVTPSVFPPTTPVLVEVPPAPVPVEPTLPAPDPL